MKVGINGFGRIGKNILKVLIDNGIDVPLVNDPFIDIEYLAYLLKYDTVHGISDCKVENGYVLYKGVKIFLSTEKLQKDIPWAKYGVDYVIEASGVFTTKEQCEQHDCKRVILTCPSEDIPMFVFGVNHDQISDQKVISAASCTTNCLAPLAKLLDDSYGIEEGFMTTVHSVTATQKITDAKGKKWRSNRSAMNIIPASTGAAKAVSKVLPSLDGKLNGMAFRVPVLNVSVVDLVVRLKKDTSLLKIKDMIEKLGNPSVIGTIDEEVVSSDMNGEKRSSVLDIKASMEMSPRYFKLISWYDNEHGYSCRVVDILKYICNK